MTTEKKHNNTKIILIIMIIIAVAAGGLYGYRVHNINEKRSEAMAQIEKFDVSKYDGDELKTVENYVADAKSKLEASKDPEEFTKIVDSFGKDTAKVKTTAQKKKEEAARKAKEEAERKAREEAEAAAAAAAAAASRSGGGDSGGCIGGGSSMFY